MSQRVDVANQALTFLGARPITGFEDETVEALLVKTHYGPCRDTMLEDAEWTFATRQFVPARLEDDPIRGFEMQFAVPAECIRVTGVYPANRGSTNPLPQYAHRDMREREVRHEQQVNARGTLVILADEEIVCKGVFRSDGEGQFPPSFAKALSFYLAYTIAPALTESNDKRTHAYQMWMIEMQKAQSLDGQRNSTRRLRTAHIVGGR